MFIGHFAVALAAKKIVPQTNLAIAFIACQLLDFVWPLLVLAGFETVRVDPTATQFTPLDFMHYPYSHSLLMTLVWAIAFGLGAASFRKDRRLGIVMGLVVLSHWFLDFLTHRPDLPLLFNDFKVGIGLWNSTVMTLLVEGSLFAGGVFLYCQATQRVTRKANILFWSLIGFLVAVYLGNAFGPTPPLDAPAAAIAGPALAMWVFVIWAHFADKSARKN